jgi:spore maturation protein SpmA/spore maturation protein SpmB
VLNAIWLFMVAAAVLCAAALADVPVTGPDGAALLDSSGREITRMAHLSNGILSSAKSAISVVIGLTGAMMLFLGLVRVATAGGLLRPIVRGLRPILTRLFPEVPPDHPAMGSMIMNFAANMLGLGNAATPFGIKAITELDQLNSTRGSATNAMALFLAINTSSVVLMAPTGTVAVRLATGSTMPFAIWIPTLIATLCSTITAVLVCLALQRVTWFRPRPPAQVEPASAPAGLEVAPLPGLDESDAEPWPLSRKLIAAGIGLGVVGFAIAGLTQAENPGAYVRDQLAVYWVLPLLVLGLLSVGFLAGVDAYSEVVAGAREGMTVAIRIAPYLVAILVAVGMFRNSGALDIVIGWAAPLTTAIGVPPEVLPMALMRPLSGSGALGIMTETLTTYGPDSFIGLLTSTLMGSTETTFYVLAVYLGAVGVRDSRHILPACLAGDVAGFFGAVAATHLFFG